MKKFLAGIFGFLFITLVAIAQKPSEIFLKWAPAGLAAGKMTIGGEYNFKKKNSVELFVGIPVPVNCEFEFDREKSDVSSKLKQS
jgi:hypothetical protein